MCTRFFIEPQSDELCDILEEARQSRLTGKFVKIGQKLHTSGEIRPNDVAAVIAPDKAGNQSVFPMRWGFQIPGRSLLVNARTETAAEKPTFRDSWRQHRCIIPASWYFEWEHLIGNSGQKKTGDKYMIQPQDSHVTFLCGLYRIEDGLPVFTVLTREPSEELKKIHDRMPLILPKECVAEWISPSGRPEELVSFALTDMVAEKIPGNA